MNNGFEKYIFEETAHAQSLPDTYPEAARELLEPTPAVHILDLPRFNELTGGFRPKEFSILCGSTGVGKTTFNANISTSLVKQGIPHFVASVETGKTDYVKRIISCLAREDWNTGKEVPLEKLKKVHAQYGHLLQNGKMWLSRYENRFDVKKLMNDIATMVSKNQIKMAIVDNINFFLEVTAAKESIVEMDRVIHELIIFCKEIDVHVIMVMHPKKTDNGRVESEFDIKGSSTAVQEAHNVFLLNRPSKELIEKGNVTRFDRELKIAKMRRMGRAVGSSIIFQSHDGVKYSEFAVYETR